MLSYLTKKTKLKLQIFGWYQIIGGVVGLLLTIWLLAHAGEINGPILLIFLIAFGLYGFSVYSGRLLLNDNFDKGLRLSVINQALQIVHFAMLGYAYFFISGSMLEIGININDGFKFKANFAVTSTWRMSIGTDDTSFTLAVNLVAIYFLYFIEKLQAQIKREKINFEDMQNAGDLPSAELNGTTDTVIDEPKL